MKIERGTKLLIDTNVLLEATDEGRRLHEQALVVFQFAQKAGLDLFLGTQVVREYLVVATRPVANNGLGMNMASALENIGRFRRRSSMIAETLRASDLFIEWAGQWGICGKKLHDLQILATASSAGMNALLTANQEDFPTTSPIDIIPLADVNW